MIRIKWSGPARSDLARLDDYYQEIDAELALNIAKQAISSARFLLSYPLLGQKIGIGSWRKWPVKGTPYLLFYTRDGETLHIQRVRHLAENWKPTP